MLRLIRIFKIIIAVAFLGVAYLLFTEQDFFGLNSSIILAIVSILGAIVIFADFQIRRNRKKRK